MSTLTIGALPLLATIVMCDIVYKNVMARRFVMAAFSLSMLGLAGYLHTVLGLGYRHETYEGQDYTQQTGALDYTYAIGSWIILVGTLQLGPRIEWCIYTLRTRRAHVQPVP